MTVAAATSDPDWDPSYAPMWRRCRERQIGEAAARLLRQVWPTESEPMWSPTPIIGYRMWVLHCERIAGATGYNWPAPSIKAVCRRQTGDARRGAPHLEAEQVCHGRCGINAYATPRALVAAAGPRLTYGTTPIGRPRPGVLYGPVSLSGRVVEHQDGYRAEYAKVIGLVMPRGRSVRATSDPDFIDAFFANPVGSDPAWETNLMVENALTIPATVADQLRRTAQQCG